MLARMSESQDTRLWHPFADMGAVRSKELVIDRGEDVWVWDAEGRRYLDATASLWYCNVGHGRPEIAEAVAAQLGRLEAYSAFGDFSNEPARELAARLASLAPMRDARVFLGSGGGDGVDTAAKLARRYWQETGAPDRDVLVVRTHAYHGTHGYGTALAGIPANRTSWGPLVPDVAVVAHDSVDALREEVDRLGPERVAAVFVEPVIGAGGVHPPAPGYIEGVAELCRETGILFICDSVISGFGRLGTWFGIERWDVEPDMIVFAKGVTSGYLPLGGVVVGGRVAEPFFAAPGGPVFRHGATYAGHATACAAAMANLDLLERDGLLARGQELEGDLLVALRQLDGHELVGEVRGGTGLLGAVELSGDLLAERPGAPQELAMLARRGGVLVRPLGAGVAVSPPLTATPDHFELVLEAVSTALDELARSRAGATA
jgi:adenosylmethionine-8-amino-7-oxononanoate aminotransferase